MVSQSAAAITTGRKGMHKPSYSSCMGHGVHPCVGGEAARPVLCAVVSDSHNPLCVAWEYVNVHKLARSIKVSAALAAAAVMQG